MEALAQTLFRAWFVDFVPVKAKAAGVLPPAMDAATAALFPSQFQESTLGLIPKGWEVRALGDLVGFLSGYSFKSSDWKDEGIPVVKIGSVKPGFVDLNNTSFVSETIAAEAKRFRLASGDLLIGMTGYVGEVGLVPPTDNPPLLNQRVGKFVFDSEGTKELAFVYCLTRRPEFKAEVE